MDTTRELNVVIKGDASDFKRAMNSVDEGGGKAQRGFRDLAIGAAGFAAEVAAAAVVAYKFGEAAVAAYQDAEKSQAMLRHAVVDVTHATEDQLKATMMLSDQLEKKGVLDGDNIKQGLAQLSTFGLSNTAVRNLGGSLADLAVNQFGVHASGEQLADSANMIAKALNGQFGILEKSGIRFTAAQKAMIQYGTETEKVTALNQGFQQNLKFTNDVAMQTSEGAMAHLQVQLGNVQEGIGGLIANAMQPLISNFTQWIDKAGGADGIMDKLKHGFEQAKPYVEGLAIAIGVGLVVALGVLAVAWAASPIGMFTLAVVGAGLAIGQIIKWLGGWDATMKKMQPVIEWFKQAWEQITNVWNTILLPALQKVWDMIQTNLMPALQELWEKHGPEIIAAFKVWAAIMGGELLVALLIIIGTVALVIDVFTKLVQVVTWVADMIKLSWQQQVNAWNQAVAAIQAGVNAFIAFFSNLPYNIGVIVGQIVGWFMRLPDNVANMVNTIINWLNQLPGRAYNALAAMANSITSWLNALPGRAQQSGQGVVNGFVSYLNNLPGMVNNIFNNVVNTISGWAGSLFNRAKDIAGRFWEGFKQGLGIHSPSYIEKAFMAIGAQSNDTLSQMTGDMSKLNDISFGNFNTLLGPSSSGSTVNNSSNDQNNRIDVTIMGNAGSQDVQDGLLSGLRIASRGI